MSDGEQLFETTKVGFWSHDSTGVEVRVWEPEQPAWKLQVAQWVGDDPDPDNPDHWLRDDVEPLRFELLDDLLAAVMGDVPNGHALALELSERLKDLAEYPALGDTKT